MSDYYAVSGNPSTGAAADSATMRAEFALISAGFDKLPDLTGVGNRVPHINAGSTAITTTSGFTFDGTTLTAPTIVASTNLNPDANDGAGIGTSALGWSDLYLASGALIDFANGNAVLTHSSGVLTVSTGDLRVTTAGTNAASAVTVGGTQTLTAKTLTSPTITTSPTAVGATWTDLGAVTTADINGGTIDGVTIGGSSAGAGTFTTLTVSGAVVGAASQDVFNTVSTTVNAFGAATTLTINAAGAIKVGLGAAALGFVGYRHGGAFVSSGASVVAAHNFYDGTLTAAAGDTAWIAQSAFSPTSTVTQGATEVIGIVATAYFAEPIITLGAGDTITVASTLYIANAPTEGGVNAALYVASGATILLGNLGVGSTSFGTSGTQTLCVKTGTAPSDSPADTVSFYSSDDTAGNTVPSFYCEGTGVVATGQSDSTSSVRVKMRINGTVRTFLCI